MQSSNLPLKKQIFSIPNLFGYFRILILPVIAWFYLTAEEPSDYYVVTGLLILSSCTDFLDGFIARKFHMVTDIGKVLDPISDKLTQGVLAICLMSRYSLMIPLVILFIIKETYMSIMGIIFIRRKILHGAFWFGKICTAILDVSIIVLIIFPTMPINAVNTLITICICFMIFSFVCYIIQYTKMLRE
ncbi:CDP-diacylglycerol--glycerol-3-phosphate 3-phosphatidyltransferase [Clostridiales bacterium CHKCI001]|nr:CDP-diacylglycerol--glycerol-3-phosphate 3-phosphatidyltransferase [Clostridiales bacterium CHKCI001]